MKAMKSAKLAALKELIKKMRKLEAEDGGGEAEEEASEEETVEEEGPLSAAAGGADDLDDDGKDDEGEIPGMKQFMKRTNKTPFKGKTKTVTLVMASGKPTKGKKLA